MREALSIDLADLGEEKLALEGALSPGELDFATVGIRQFEPLDWSASIEPTGEGFRLTGRLVTGIELECVRCLEPVREPVRREFDLFFESRESLVYEEDEEIELEEADTQTAFITGTELVFGEVIREQVLLALPMKPLCNPDCHGLCPTCGTNLNRETCECSIKEFNPAFEVLRDFKKQLEERSS